MTDPALAPRSPLWGLAVTWAAGVLGAIAIGVFAPRGQLMTWYVIGFGLCIVLSFIMQLLRGETRGFILRVSAGALGALLAMGLISVGFGLGAVLTA